MFSTLIDTTPLFSYDLFQSLFVNRDTETTLKFFVSKQDTADVIFSASYSVETGKVDYFDGGNSPEQQDALIAHFSAKFIVSEGLVTMYENLRDMASGDADHMADLNNENGLCLFCSSLDEINDNR